MNDDHQEDFPVRVKPSSRWRPPKEPTITGDGVPPPGQAPEFEECQEIDEWIENLL